MKIIGIILFVLLLIIGLVLLVTALVLFAPVRYRVSAVFENDEKSVTAKIRWLLGLVSVTISYTGETQAIVRIFGIRPDKLKRKKKKVKGKKNKPSEKGKSKAVEKNAGKSTEKPVNSVAVRTASSNTESNKEASESQNKTKAKKRPFAKIRSSFKKISDLHIRNYWDILRAPDNKGPFSILKGRLWTVIKHSSPKKIQADLIIGTGDPCNTGLLFGFFGIMMSFVPGVYNLTPDFYEKCLKGKLYITGRIRMVVLLYHAIKIITDKELKRIKKDIDKVRA